MRWAIVRCAATACVLYFFAAIVPRSHGEVKTHTVASSRARILVCNGGDDGLITDEQIATFQQNVRDAGADWQFISYGGAKHSFTNPDADKRGMAAIAYNAKADKRSWAAMLSLFAEIW